MVTEIMDKETYINGYKALQIDWKKKGKEFLLVGRLAYWTYWLSKMAENSKETEEKKTLFQLKTNGLLLLSKSDYVQLRKFVPPYHKRICFSHYQKMKNSKYHPHRFLEVAMNDIQKCPKCKKSGINHFYSLYSVAILNGKEDTDIRKPLFIMYVPYLQLKEQFPELDTLKSIKRYAGTELATIHPSEKTHQLEVSAMDKETVIRYFTKNYDELTHFFGGSVNR